MDERKAFDIWWASRPGTWRGSDHELLFVVWQAATKQERERAAKVCESFATCPCNGSHGVCLENDTAFAFAAAIRRG